MKRTIYTLTAAFFLIVFTSAISTYKNKTLVLPPDDKELVLPNQTYDYSVNFPENVLDFMMGWGIVDTTLVSNIDNDVATLGRVLFYDDRLSGDNSLSCGSCHKQELSFADNVAFSNGIDNQLTFRNSMVLNDLGWQLSFQFFWDFRSSGMEDAVMQPIIAAHELGKNIPDLITKLEVTEEYQPLFQAAFGTTEIDANKIAISLAQFIASMTTFESRYDEGFNTGFNNFTPSELNGLNLFEANCSFCHITPHFGSTDPFSFVLTGNNGLDSTFTDLGMGEWMPDVFLEGTFKSPSLRNIEVSAPYMHDGRFSTLEEVIDFYSEGVQFNETSAFNWMFGEDFTGYDFTDGEKNDLINFLNTLTDHNFLSNDKWSNPWQTILSNTPELLVGVKVYPNPVADVVVVDFSNTIGETYNISIYNINGKLVNTFKTSGNNFEVPRGNAPSGVYELVASNGHQQKTFKLVYR